MSNNKKKEGGIFASRVRYFLNEYGSENQEEFCKMEHVSYSKMCNCLGRPSYRKPTPAAKPSKSVQDIPTLPELRKEFEMRKQELIEMYERKISVLLEQPHRYEKGDDDNTPSFGNLPDDMEIRVKCAERFARLISLFANIEAHKLIPLYS